MGSTVSSKFKHKIALTDLGILLYSRNATYSKKWHKGYALKTVKSIKLLRLDINFGEEKNNNSPTNTSFMECVLISDLSYKANI